MINDQTISSHNSLPFNITRQTIEGNPKRCCQRQSDGEVCVLSEPAPHRAGADQSEWFVEARPELGRREVSVDFEERGGYEAEAVDSVVE